MNCLELRRLIESEPDSTGPEIDAHLHSCPACASFVAETRALDARVRQALAIPVPVAAETRATRRAPRSSSWLALAASVLLGVGIAALVWLSFPRPSLADELVAHVEHEPQAWTASAALPVPAVMEVLKSAGVIASLQPGRVSYARSCWFRGHWIPHLVVEDESGPVTVLVLTNENVPAAVSFSEAGYNGVIVPARHGSIAVVSRDAVQIESVAARVMKEMNL